MTQTMQGKFDMIDGGAADPKPTVGHYFDQAVFDLNYVLLMARARRLDVLEEAEALFSVDRNGKVALRAG